MDSITQAKAVGLAAAWTPGLYGLVFSSILTGISVSQAYIYLLTSREGLVIRGTIIFLLVLDILGTGVTTGTYHNSIIGGYSDSNQLLTIPKYFCVENLATVLSTLVVQAFLARQIYIVNRRWWPLSAIILFFCFVELAMGITTTYAIAQTPNLTEMPKKPMTNLLPPIWNSIAAFVDIIATIGLCSIFQSAKANYRRTNSLLSLFVAIFINRGILVTLAQILFVVFWFIQKEKMLWLPFLICLSKLYIVTLFSILNTRVVIHVTAGNEEKIGRISIGPRLQRSTLGRQNSVDGAQCEIHITRVVETVTTGDETPKEAFAMKGLSGDHDDAESR